MNTIVERYRYIAVEGPIAVGKTTLTKLLATTFNAEIMLEDAEANPFLERFYRQPDRYAFVTQMFFLFQRTLQASSLKQRDLFESPTISDFLLDKDLLFAKLNLANDEFELYQHMYQHLRPTTPTPDLVIYLQASADVLIERLDRRGWFVEKPISEKYLRTIAESYTQFFHDYDASPLLIVNSDNLNFADDPEDYQLLLSRIQQIRSRREFFNRA
ncbi:MAG: deoxynucleoside kinase [Betaproteobacteria bacterium]|nr:deoxynucleoside kinase [Betaproteobacteria bacterium]MDE2422883.1 deoxynucleoside kinase [Betaproteobacteria bacterium]